MIKINNISFARGNSLIFKNISFQARPGDILVLKGANGKGKTTLLSNITNFLEPLEGEILYQDQKVENTHADWALLSPPCVLFEDATS